MNSDPLVAHDKKETFKKTKYTVTRVQVEKLLKSFEVTTTFNSPHPFVMLLDVAPCLESSRAPLRKNEKPQEDYYAGSKVSVCGNDPPGDSFFKEMDCFLRSRAGTFERTAAFDMHRPQIVCRVVRTLSFQA